MFFNWLNISKILLKLIATLCVASLFFTIYLLFTPHGSEVFIRIISETTHYQIKYKKFSGYLARQVYFDGLHLTGKDLDLQAKNLHIRWNIIDLMKPTKSIEMLDAHDFTLNYQGKQPSMKRAGLISPFPFIVENLTLHGAFIKIGKDEHQMDLLTLKRASTSNLNSIEEIHYRGIFGELDAKLTQSIDAKWDLHFKNAPFFSPYLSGNVITKGHIFLPKRKWRDPNNQINITLRGSKAALEGSAIQDYLLTLKGTLANHQGELRAEINKTPFQTTFTGKLSATSWQASIERLAFQSPYTNALNNTSGTIDINWSQSEIISKINLLLSEKQPISAQLDIQKNKARSVKGNIQANIKSLKTLAPFFPELRRVRGSASIDIGLSGKLNHIHYEGTIFANDLRVNIPALKSTAVIPELQVTLLKNHSIELSGEGTIGSGNFSLNGTGTLKGDSPSLAIRLKGEQLLLSDTPEYYIVANPDLTFTLKNTGPKIEGTIYIPQAEIKSLKNPEAISPSQDVVIVSNKKTTTKTIPNYSLAKQLRTKIEIVLGDKITYEGYGISTHATGQLSIRQLPGQPTKARGKITLLKGKYRAYGKNFNIAEGELLFTGGIIENPTLNIRAERKIQTSPSAKSFHVQNTIIAGVKFVGPLSNTHIEFYSSPTMSNADIISYLVVGQPQSQMNQAQADLLFQALSQLTLLSGNKRNDVKMDLAEQLKLDQFGFAKKENSLSNNSNNPLQDTVLVLGKQLSDRLYLHYSLGLVDSSNSVGLRYFVNKNMTIEASTGTEGSSADLLLTFEGH